LVTLVRNAPRSPKVQQENSKRSPSRKLERAKVKGKMHELAEEDDHESAPAQGEVLMPLISAVEHSDDVEMVVD
jgi:hypothetical protein